MKIVVRAAGLFLGVFLLSSCGSALREPERLDSGGVLDLRNRNFSAAGPVIPQGWQWDADVFWTPGTGGRPEGLSAPVSAGAPERGGTLPASLQRQRGTAQATAQLTVLVPEARAYGLQIGALPGAGEVWVNGVRVWSSGTAVRGPEYRADGGGAVVSIQPRDGRLDIVAAFVTDDPLVRHYELNRSWIVGPQQLVSQEVSERLGRLLQAAVLLFGAVLFAGLALLRPQRRALSPFVGFLLVCLAKMVVNVEEAQPLLGPFLPGMSPSWLLFLNHGLNLLPFPLFVLFLVRQYPEDVTFRSFLVVVAATVLTTAWELLPFVLLAAGAADAYAAVLRLPWTFILNLYVVVLVLFIFERIYHVFDRRRPLAQALFWGGAGIGLMVLIPVPLSYFLPVKYTFFLGWGVFLFLVVLGTALIRLQIRTTDTEIRLLSERLALKDRVSRFLATGWAERLGKEAIEAAGPGDHKASEVIFVQVCSAEDPERWLQAAGSAAAARGALFVEWRQNTALWVMESWPETALALALEVQVKLVGSGTFRVVLTKAEAEFRVLDAGSSWPLTVEHIPTERLSELDALALRCGTSVLLEETLQVGLVIGGWKRHRRVTLSGREIEFYEAEEESLAGFKDKTLDSFEAALAQARKGQYESAIPLMVEVVRRNPFDKAALALLSEWGSQV